MTVLMERLLCKAEWEAILPKRANDVWGKANLLRITKKHHDSIFQLK